MSTALSVAIIEANASDLQMIQHNLSAAKIRCRWQCAESGADAMAMLQGTGDQPVAPIDLVLLDLSLPDIDGLDVLDQTRDLPALSTAVIVALTGSLDPGIVHTARERGVHAIMSKPLNVSHLLGIMAEQGFWIELSR